MPNVRTDPDGLTDADLPMATGDESPPVIARPGEIGFGLRDFGQLIEFAEAAGRGRSILPASETTSRPSRRSTAGSASASTTT